MQPLAGILRATVSLRSIESHTVSVFRVVPFAMRQREPPTMGFSVQFLSTRESNTRLERAVLRPS